MQITATTIEKVGSWALPWRRILISAAFTLVLQGLVAIVLFALYASQPQVSALSTVSVQELPNATPSHIDDNAWQALELPAKLCRSECTSRFKVYRIQLGDRQDRVNQALYVRMFDGSMAAYLNDRKIGQTGSMREPIADMTYQPAYFDIPESLWTAESNVLDIIVASLVPEGGRLTAPFVGDSEALNAAYRVAHGLTVDSLAVINGVLFMFLFISVLFFFAAQRDYLFISFALVLLFCIARNMNVLLPEWPANDVLRNGIYLCATLGVLLASAGFISRLVARNTTRFDLVLLSAWLPASMVIVIGLLIDMWTTWAAATTLTRLLTVTLGTWLLIRFIRFSRTLPPVVQGSIFALLAAALTLMLHDTIGSYPPRILIFQTSNLAALPVILSFCIVLAHRYREYLLRVRSQNRLLTAAVASKEADLASSYKQLGKARDAEVLAEERQRIMQDMHDGVGGRLAALLQRLRLEPGVNTGLTNELQTSLNDLRLIIDSLDITTSGKLSYALGTFRQRVEPWLEENGIGLDWSVELHNEHRPGPEHTLQIYRLLQESLNNVVRHSGAERVSIWVRDDNAHLHVTVADNGRGMPEKSYQGRGLDIMRRRAASMHGELLIDSSQQGLTLTTSIPLSPP